MAYTAWVRGRAACERVKRARERSVRGRGACEGEERAMMRRPERGAHPAHREGAIGGHRLDLLYPSTPHERVPMICSAIRLRCIDNGVDTRSIRKHAHTHDARRRHVYGTFTGLQKMYEEKRVCVYCAITVCVRSTSPIHSFPDAPPCVSVSDISWRRYLFNGVTRAETYPLQNVAGGAAAQARRRSGLPRRLGWRKGCARETTNGGVIRAPRKRSSNKGAATGTVACGRGARRARRTRARAHARTRAPCARAQQCKRARRTPVASWRPACTLLDLLSNARTHRGVVRVCMCPPRQPPPDSTAPTAAFTARATSCPCRALRLPAPPCCAVRALFAARPALRAPLRPPAHTHTHHGRVRARMGGRARRCVRDSGADRV
eukprot:IDg2937t1